MNFLKKEFIQEGVLDKSFLVLTLLLLGFGILAFFSASLSLPGRSESLFYRVIFTQIGLGLLGGLCAMFLVSRINTLLYKKYALWFLGFSVVLMILVFVPGVGFEHGGAKRWISLGFISFQPAEIIKLTAILYAGAWFAWVKDKIKTYSYGFFAVGAFLGFIGLLFLLQPDTDTFIILALSVIAMYMVAGGRWKHFFIFFTIGIILLGSLILIRPYILERVKTFIDPSRDPQGASWHIEQSLLAVGSGRMTGRGFGQSVQKFNYLPEPIGDSIYAVIGEEFGFLGTVFFVILYTWFGLRGLKIATQTNDDFSRLIVIGLIVLILSQAFLNIGSTIGIVPVSGLPLPFVSQGGTALFFNLIAVGIILSVSRQQGLVKKYNRV